MRFRPVPRLLVAAVLLLPAVPAQAVIVSGGNGSQNTTAAGAGSGWDYVGSVNGASGVYLGAFEGAQWVLTAGHVGAADFSLNGSTFPLVTGSAVALTGEAGVVTDLVMFRIDGDPGLAPLTLAPTTPLVGSAVTMIGHGFNRESALTRWSVTWEETGGIFGVHQGYKWSAGQPKRWGRNTVSNLATYAGASALVTTFSSVSGSAQATVGDSGGGVFLADGSLAGIMVAVTSLSGQPPSTSVFGNQTYSIDVASLRPQILAVMASVPEPGSVLLLAVALVFAAGGGALRLRRASAVKTTPAAPR